MESVKLCEVKTEPLPPGKSVNYYLDVKWRFAWDMFVFLCIGRAVVRQSFGRKTRADRRRK